MPSRKRRVPQVVLDPGDATAFQEEIDNRENRDLRWRAHRIAQLPGRQQMTPQQWEILRLFAHAIWSAVDAAEMIALTVIPLAYLYTAARWPQLRYAFTSTNRTTPPADTLPRWRTRRTRALRPHDPTVVLRDLPYPGSSLYRSGPRPLVALTRIRLGRVRIIREHLEHEPRTRKRSRITTGGRHRAD